MTVSPAVAQAAHTHESEAAQIFSPAVLFLSIASASPVDRLLGGEPIKIQLQREAAHRTAIQHGVGIVKEFVEIGAPATALRHRPIMRHLLAYLKTHPDVRHVIFPGAHRIARSPTHAELLRRHFSKLDIRIILANSANNGAVRLEGGLI